MRRPSPAPAPRPAAPPARATAPGPPPRRATGARPPAAPPGTGAPPSRSGPRAAPPRPPGPPAARRRRRPILIAAALTLVILLAYGGYSAWNAITGGGSDSTTTADASDYETLVARNIFFAAQVLGQGIDTRLVGDLQPFYENANRVIFTMGLDRVALGKLAAGATGPQREVIASTQQSLDAMQAALADWRDAVYNLRLAAIEDAHAEVDSAITRLQGDLERWKAAPSS